MAGANVCVDTSKPLRAIIKDGIANFSTGALTLTEGTEGTEENQIGFLCAFWCVRPSLAVLVE